jgi:hypothetical protein
VPDVKVIVDRRTDDRRSAQEVAVRLCGSRRECRLTFERTFALHVTPVVYPPAGSRLLKGDRKNSASSHNRRELGCSTGKSAGLLLLAPNFFFQRRTAGIRFPERSVSLRIREGEGPGWQISPDACASSLGIGSGAES